MNISSFFKKYALPLFVIAIISRSIEEISFIYYTVPVFLVLFILIGLKEIKFSESRFRSLLNWNKDCSDDNSVTAFPFTFLLLVLATIVWYISSALWSDYPIVSLQRGFYFGLLATGCILGGYLWMKGAGKKLFDYLLPANIIIIALSIFSVITNIPGDSWTGGHGKGFMGYLGHQNQLGSLILFTVPAVFYKLISNRHSGLEPESAIQDKSSTPSQTDQYPESSIRYQASNIIFYCLLLASNIIILALTYSRASWLSLVAGILTFLILIKNWKIIIISFSLFTFLFLLVFSFPALK